jgi:hypothetical protein
MTTTNTARRGGKSRLTNNLPTPATLPKVSLPRLRYPRPAAPIRQPSEWGNDWFLAWNRLCGTVYTDMETGELCALYSNSRDPKDRLRLQDELEARPNGVAEVIATVEARAAAFDRLITIANQEYHSRRLAR